ncbi:MAG: hypothetical protein JWL70_3165 [Acidimicrobiia bacterium]|nr:hypothetical protein [Acidimicrobiia bacterium]
MTSLGPALRVESVVLRPDSDSARLARRFVGDYVPKLRSGAATSVTSELVTNALVYSDGDIRVTISLSAACVRIEVWDGNLWDVPVPRPILTWLEVSASSSCRNYPRRGGFAALPLARNICLLGGGRRRGAHICGVRATRRSLVS